MSTPKLQILGSMSSTAENIEINTIDGLNATNVQGALEEVKNIAELTTDEAVELLIETDMLLAVMDNDGAILTDENNDIIMW